MKIILTNCRIISPGLDIKNGTIEIVDDKIVEATFSTGIEFEEDCRVYDLDGKTAVPGFIDIHTHGAGGYDSSSCTGEGIEKISELKIREGVTTFCPTFLTIPNNQMKKSAEAVEKYKTNRKFAKVCGIHLEGPYLSLSNIGAQNPNFVRPPDLNEVLEIDKITKVKIVTLAPEIPGGVELIQELKKRDIVPSCGHSAAVYSDFLKAKGYGLKHLTHFCNQMTKLHHREIGLVGAGLLDDDVIIEVICDKIHLISDMIQLALKSRTADKIVLITDSMAASWLDDGEYDLGGLPVTVKNSVATLTEKGNLAGSTLKYNAALKNITEISDIPLSELIKMTGLNQAVSLGLENVGRLEKGYKADITVLNKNFEPEMVFVEGELKLEA
ncbi:MAG: N-acetylglucosamine-6-phosphate deacetylase [Victivallales bacterium]|nr:N-acetylglucosamine-6-phosphate deacetylase [Victivallales bacterium]